MTNQHTRVSGDSESFAISSTTTDAPILPVAQMERLHQFAPEKINWIFEQTEIEAEERRRIKREVNAFVAQGERRGMWLALVVTIAGIAGACFCAYFGREIAASVIGGLSLALVASAFIFGSKRGT